MGRARPSKHLERDYASDYALTGEWGAIPTTPVTKPLNHTVSQPDVITSEDAAEIAISAQKRVEAVREARRVALYENGYGNEWDNAQAALRKRIMAAKLRFPSVALGPVTQAEWEDYLANHSQI